MKPVYNFCAGPAMLPAEVMQKAQREFVNWQNHGISVMEFSHRDKHFMAVAEAAEQNLRKLMNIPDNYKVLFSHGGGRGQFAAVPLNLIGLTGKADYLVTGSWSKAAVAEGKKFGEINVVAQPSVVGGLNAVASPNEWQLSDDASYFHYCPNETVDGIEMFNEPEVGVPLVADMSSTILSREIDVSKYGVIYAGAQKNIGPSGLSIVIVREDLLGHALDVTPSIIDYKTMSDNDSMYNTPPTYAWYLAGEVFKWLLDQGGVPAIEALNKKKADLLYDFIDSSDYYRNGVEPSFRSRMNVTFQLADEADNAAFLAGAEEAGLMALKGHRSVGGMRASIYNAMPLAGVEALVQYMEQFQQR
ncbi:3-phosphoserine/phosphohydroxythreonine transaminase [Psychrobium sp. 1_MG-2023]|uniref:3-phosphoserine/phosphohydroxythreonine transaminase n=1 Tax=Psychrobium sp. 1_MG-2023 TaxID=3062624 RepID=UPI000C320472|nr:3-phosphoserine/phosphohydroxythreonine transaminase [Psychrobium sp. 1_MG-2023]MDP2560142.1 3-phosphoserine/phosphohydroxythreonine transaminase [Psychrobium sp. 1_MG-2023]PKF56955.1 phosphoserine transaminase [Alteromonadales bacterium alter-6D02]